jgi:hypothetical protein
MSKICPTCKIEKEDSEFYTRGRSKILASKCKSCFNLYCVERWKNRKLKEIAKFGGKCLDCGNEYHYSVYEFHHLHSKDVSWVKLKLKSQKAIDKELSKCVLLCANCHRIRHYGVLE